MAFTETYHKEKFLGLDFARGLAAFAVMVCHYWQYGRYDVPEYLGDACVVYFFVLSGFVLTHAYEKEISNKAMTFKNFFIARFARLYPLHFLTFCGLAFYWLILNQAAKLGVPIETTKDFSLIPILEDLFLVQSVFTDSGALNSPAWSIGVEFWCGFYIFALCFLNKNYKILSMVVVTILYLFTISSGGFFNGQERYAHEIFQIKYIAGLFLFGLGYFVYSFFQRFKTQIYKCRRFLLLSSLPLILTFLFLWPPPLKENFYLEILYFAIIGFSVLALATYQTHSNAQSFVMETIGNLSYGIYLWHVPVMLAFVGMSKFLLYMNISSDILSYNITTIVYFLTVLVVAYLSFNFFEKPSKTWIKSKFKA